MKKLNSEQKTELIRLYRSGITNATIAKRTKINYHTVTTFLYKYAKVQEVNNQKFGKKYYDNSLTEEELLNPKYLQCTYDQVKKELGIINNDKARQ